MGDLCAAIQRKRTRNGKPQTSRRLHRAHPHTPRRSRPLLLPKSQARSAKRYTPRSSLACARHAVTRACETIPPPRGVAAWRACHAPDAAMPPPGDRRASRAPVHDHSRPIPPSSCRDARKLAPANPRPPRNPRAPRKRRAVNWSPPARIEQRPARAAKAASRECVASGEYRGIVVALRANRQSSRPSARIAPAQSAPMNRGTLRRHAPYFSLCRPLRPRVGSSRIALNSDRAACATSRLSAHPAPMSGAMRELLQTTLVPRLPAPCHVAAQGLPASARLCGSAHCQPGCSLNARPPLPATAAGQLPRLASRVAALRASARNVRHPTRASCCDALCGLARSLNQALRAQSPRPASLRSPAPRPATATPSPRYRRARSPPAPICLPFARGVASLPPSCHSYRIASRAPPTWNGSRCSRSVSCKGALRRALTLPSLGWNRLRASLARCRGATELQAPGASRLCFVSAPLHSARR